MRTREYLWISKYMWITRIEIPTRVRRRTGVPYLSNDAVSDIILPVPHAYPLTSLGTYSDFNFVTSTRF